MSSSFRAWGIRMGDWVELRIGVMVPRARISKLTKLHEGRKVVLKQKFYVGGRVVGHMPLTKFRAKVFNVEKDGMVELPYHQTLAVLNVTRRRKFIDGH